jgi:polyphosphate glucokinase
MRVLVIDVGGSNVKVHLEGREGVWKIPSGPAMTAREMVGKVKAVLGAETYDVISMGYPGVVVHGRPAGEPFNLGGGWSGFDFARAFGHPVRLANDAALQALGSYDRGRLLFLGLGTGLGSAMIINGVVQSMELAHLPYKKGRSYEDFVGKRGRKRLGKKKWRKAVLDMIARLRAALLPDSVVIGGGNAKDLKRLPAGVRVGNNTNAFVGGLRLWADARPRRRAASART